MLEQTCRLSHLSVGRSVYLFGRVNCGKMADWNWMPFGVVSGVSQGMGVLDVGGDHQREGRVSFGGKYGASHCNRWGLCCIVM